MNVYDNQGRKLGQMNDYGTVSDNDGYKVGDVSEDGMVTDRYGRHIGNVSEDGTITDSDQSKLGEVSEDGTVTDSNGSKVGKVSISHDDTITKELGFSLIIFPIGTLLMATGAIREGLIQIRSHGSPIPVLDQLLGFQQFLDLIGLPEIRELEKRFAHQEAKEAPTSRPSLSVTPGVTKGEIHATD
jgi:hypothetical protein